MEGMHGDHAGHDHGHAGHHDMQHPETSSVASAVVAAASSTVASILNQAHDHMSHSEHEGAHGGHDGTHGGEHHDTDHGSMNHDMKMWFHTGYSEIVLFESWKISTIGGLVGSMIGIFFMAALYEGLKYYREYLFWKTYNALQYRSVTIPEKKSVVPEDNQIVQPTMFSWMHAFQTLLHIIQIVLSYFLMLIFMTYNVWLCLAVVFGAAVGYFMFGWKKPVVVDVTEHCH